MALIIHNTTYHKNEHCLDSAELINRSINAESIDDFILIVPTGKLTRNLKYRTIEDYYRKNGKPSSEINIFNFGKFAEYCFKLILPNSSFRILSESYRMTLTEEAVQNADLEFYSTKGKSINYHILERLSNIIYGLREDGINHNAMFEELSRIEADSSGIKDYKKYSDIAKILIEYEKLLSDRYLDPPALLNLLIKYAENENLADADSKKTIFDEVLNSHSKIKQILVYGFSEFKNPEVEFLSKFARSTIPVSVHLDFSEINGPLFGNLKEMKDTLLTAGFNFFYTEDEIPNPESAQPEADLDRNNKYFLRRWLFNVEREIKYTGLSDNLKIFEFENTDHEVRQICKLVNHLILDKGYKPSEIAVVSRDTGRYSPLFREMFNLEKIPANFSDRYPLAESQIAIAVLSVLDTIAYGFRRNDVIKTLESRFINIINGSGQPLDLSNLIQSAKDLRFPQSNYRLSSEFWKKRISNAIEYLKSLQAVMIDESAGSLDLKNIDRRLKSYQRALEDFSSFSDSLPERKSLFSPDEFKILIVKQIIEKFGIVTTIRELYEEINSKFTGSRGYEYNIQIESVEKFSRSLAELLRILEEMTFILKDRSNKKYKLIELIEKLKLSVSAARYQTREKQNYGVTVTAIEQIREIPYKVTILCGLNDGIFPMPYKPESFLGKELAETELRHLHSEQIQFYRFLINGSDEIDSADKRIYLSYSKYHSQYEAARSSFIDSLLKVTNLSEKGNPVIIPASGISEDIINQYPWINSISNRSEIAEMFGRYYFNNRSKMSEFIKNIPEAVKTLEIIDIADYTDKFSLRMNSAAGNGLSFLEETAKIRLAEMDKITYSATDFETYAKCGFKYFSKKLLSLQESDEESMTINALEFGNLMHTALYKFYIGLQKESSEQWLEGSQNSANSLPVIKPVNIKGLDKSALAMRLIEIIIKEFEDIKFDHPFIKLAQREILGNDDMFGWAEHFIESEYDRLERFESFPAGFEFEFGSQNGVPAVNIGNGIFLRGKIDRVEISPSEIAGDKSKFTIVDYKTSMRGTASNNDIEKGRSFQMPLYSLALKNILKDYYGIDAELQGSAYYILKPVIEKGTKKDTKTVLMPNFLAGESKRSNKIDSFEMQELFLQQSVQNAKNIIEKITAGTFRVEPLNAGVCQYCSYKPVCRINERSILTQFEENEDTGDSEE